MEIQVEEQQKHWYLVSGMVLATINGQMGQTTISAITAIEKPVIDKLDYAQFHDVLSREFYRVMLEDMVDDENDKPVIEITKITVQTISPMGRQTEEEYSREYSKLEELMNKTLDTKE